MAENVISGEEYLGKKDKKPIRAEVEVSPNTTSNKQPKKPVVAEVEKPKQQEKKPNEKRIVAEVEDSPNQKRTIKEYTFHKKCVGEEIWHIFTEKYGYTYMTHVKKSLAVGAGKPKVKEKANVPSNALKEISDKYASLGYTKIETTREV